MKIMPNNIDHEAVLPVIQLVREADISLQVSSSITFAYLFSSSITISFSSSKLILNLHLNRKEFIVTLLHSPISYSQKACLP